MARQVIWTDRAQKERIAIFKYWNKRNESSIYRLKLYKLINESLKLICAHPLLGKLSDKENVRVKVLSDYLIIYETTFDFVIVLSIWDCPSKS